MNTSERLAFYNALKDSKNKFDIDLTNFIKYPKNLYRYRTVNSKSLAALLENKMYFSSSNYYDDPFDTNIFVDENKLSNSLENYLNKVNGNSGEFKNDLSKMDISIDLSKFNIQSFDVDKLKYIINKMIEDIRNEIKKQTYSVCFSETEFNETLWLKYANNHQGFVVEYDIHKDYEEHVMCGINEECSSCINNFKMSLYPIIYTDEKYDATKFAEFYMAIKAIELLKIPNEVHSKFVQLFNANFKFDREIITLIKKKCHEYDLEWRIIGVPYVIDNKPVYKCWKPKSITLGLRMSQEDEKLVIEMARQAGIKEIYKICIDKKGDLNKKQLK